MGLRCVISVNSLGLPLFTPVYMIPIDYSLGFDVLAETFQSYAKTLVPVDTGYLQSTIVGTSQGMSAVCETNCSYAEYVEYGTIYMAPQSYFEPALRLAISAAIPCWRNAVEQALAQERMLEEMELAAKEAVATAEFEGQEREAEINFDKAKYHREQAIYYDRIGMSRSTPYYMRQQYFDMSAEHMNQAGVFAFNGAMILGMAIMALFQAIANIIMMSVFYEGMEDMFINMFYETIADMIMSASVVEII